MIVKNISQISAFMNMKFFERHRKSFIIIYISLAAHADLLMQNYVYIC